METAVEAINKDPLLDKAHFDDHEHPAWDYKATIAYAATTFTIEGAILFGLGAIFQLDVMANLLPHTGKIIWGFKAWVSYPYFIGGVCFTIANYLCYFQVINKHKSHDDPSNPFKVNWLGKPLTWDHGSISCIMNLLGALWYNFNTAAMFGWPSQATRFGMNLVTSTGILGSVFFVLAAILQGEYNDWRKCGTFSYPILISHCNFWGGVLFLVGYVCCWDDMASEMDMEQTLVTLPFFLGAVLFLIGAWCDLILWKKEIFGLAFAKELSTQGRHVDVNVSQMIMIAFYIINISLSWFRLGAQLADPAETALAHCAYLGVTEKLLTYHVILFLCSAVHKLPDEHPYDYLMRMMNAVAIFGVVGEFYMVISDI